MKENDISGIIVEAAIEVHRTLGGPGLLESVYEECLTWELRMRGLEVIRQKELPLLYKGFYLVNTYRLDLLVERKVIIECKAVEKFHPVFLAQTLTYLRLSGLKLALILNFGERFLRDGIHRVVNGLGDGEDVNAETLRRRGGMERLLTQRRRDAESDMEEFLTQRREDAEEEG